jgi:hypothetical protein
MGVGHSRSFPSSWCRVVQKLVVTQSVKALPTFTKPDVPLLCDSRPLDHTLSQMNPFPTLKPYFSKIHFNSSLGLRGGLWSQACHVLS